MLINSQNNQESILNTYLHNNILQFSIEQKFHVRHYGVPKKKTQYKECSLQETDGEIVAGFNAFWPEGEKRNAIPSS